MPSPTPTPTRGDGYASFLLGGVSGSSNYPLFPWWKQYYGAVYVNDDWKVTRKSDPEPGSAL